MSFHHTIDGALLDRILQKIDSARGRELVATLVCVGDDVEAAIAKLAYEYKYRCVVDDEMGPANAPTALDLSENLEHALLVAKQVLEAELAKEPVSR